MKNVHMLSRLTGVGYLVIFLTGFFANFYTLERLVVDGNASLTAVNIVQHGTLFFWGLFAFALMVAVDIALAFPLYTLFTSVDKKLARVSSVLRLINGVIFGIALLNLVEVALLSHYGVAKLEPNVIPLVQKFDGMWNIALLFFGAHLLLLGWLLRRSTSFPTSIGILLQIAGVGYLIDSSAQLVLPTYEQFQAIFQAAVIIPGVLGEFSLTLWLLLRRSRAIGYIALLPLSSRLVSALRGLH